MQTQAILFDLDGTLLPLEFNEFIPGYFSLLSKKFADVFAGSSLPKLVMASTDAMVNNDGVTTNADAFWSDFEIRSSKNRNDLLPLFEKFYRDDFGSLGADVDRWENSADIVRGARSAGLVTVLATNPVFPRTAIMHRLAWAGIDSGLFDLITDYENMSFTKPNPGYFSEIASMIGVAPPNCLMIGNDVGLDLEPARAAGMKTFLLRNDYSVDESDGFTPDYEGTLDDIIKIFTK